MNLLGKETSPYLLQHKDNPVHWRAWDAAALNAAKAEEKPIFLSIGYAACHWCHVMAHESFEDPGIAEILNRDFICIKVDREERPDIDAIYQQALAVMGGQGGWPLSMFLTPEGAPFWGGTYFPPTPMHGLPSFTSVIRGVANGFKDERAKVDHNVGNIAAALESLSVSAPGGAVTSAMLDHMGDFFLKLIDPANGGIGTAPKFPNLTVIAFLWDMFVATSEDKYKFAVILSLTHMCQGGMYDHIGGGFCRYSVDAEWLVPHFEKMLCDNALFIDLLTEVWRETQNLLFKARVTETVGWLLREMRLDNGGFAASLDADSDGEEGLYYIWRAHEVEDGFFREIYDITSFGNWEGVNIPNRLHHLALLSDEDEARLAVNKEKLLGIRQLREPPARDDKMLADWNGMAIAALAKAGFVFDNQAWINAARDCFKAAQKCLGQNDGFVHSYAGGKKTAAAMLDDQAQMGLAALSLFDVTGDDAYHQTAKKIASHMQQIFGDDDGAFFMTPKDAGLILRQKPADDSSVPSGNGAACLFLAGMEETRNAADKTLRVFSGHLQRSFFGKASLARAALAIAKPVTVTFGDKKLTDVLRHVSLPQGHIRHDGAINSTMVCIGARCLAPVQTAEELTKTLKNIRCCEDNVANDI